tara:strand:- start:1127 stop:1819 length:693 start_codon:yes stop_codon:yes gene_type:complete
MKLTDYTTQVLKNFSGINSNLIFRSGNEVSTISEAKNILSTASLDVNFPSEFGIYDLNEFLGVLSLVDEPQIKFEEKFAVISDSTGRSKIKYFFTDVEMLTSPNTTMLSKAMAMNDFEVTFTLDQDTMNKIKRATSALGHTSVAITPSDGSIALTVFDPENITSNIFTIELAGKCPSNENFNFILNIQNLKILPGDYDVSLSSKLMAKFTHTEKKVNYWIALEKTSTYGE